MYEYRKIEPPGTTSGLSKPPLIMPTGLIINPPGTTSGSSGESTFSGVIGCIDRFEGEEPAYAVVLDENGNAFNISPEDLPNTAKEGDWIEWKNGRWQFLPESGSSAKFALPTGVKVVTAQTQPGGFIGPMDDKTVFLSELDKQLLPDDAGNIKPALEELLNDPSTAAIIINDGDPIFNPDTIPVIDTEPSMRAVLPGEIIDQPKEKPNVIIEFLDEMTGFSEMMKFKGDESLMAWLCILPLGTARVGGTLAKLLSQISGKTFIKMVEKQTMILTLEAAQAEARTLAKTETLNAVETVLSKLRGGAYLPLKELQPLVDKIGAAITKEGTAAAAETVTRIAGVSSMYALKKYFDKTPLLSKIAARWKPLAVAGGLLSAYAGQIIWGSWALTEAPEPYGFTATKLIGKDAATAKQLLQSQQKMGGTTWPLYIPLFGVLWAFLRKQTGILEAGKAILESKTLADAAAAEKQPLNPADLPESGEYKIIQVVDGDTVHAYINNHRVSTRLVGINTPEKGETYSTAAKKFLEILIGNLTAIIKIDPANPIDTKWNRALGIIYFNGQDINRAMIRAGWASTDFIGVNKYVNQEIYKQAEDLAKAEGRGIWSMGKMPTVAEIKARYLANIFVELQARIALENLLILGESVNDYINLWNIAKAKAAGAVKPLITPTMPGMTGVGPTPTLTPEQIFNDRYLALKKLSKGEQTEILRTYGVLAKKVPDSEDGRIRMIISLQDSNAAAAAAKAASITPTATAPITPTPTTPITPTTIAPVTPPVTPTGPAELSDRSWDAGITQPEAKSKREIEIWYLNKEQQLIAIYKLKFPADVVGYKLTAAQLKRLPTMPYEQDRVRELNKLEMQRDYPQGQAAGATTTTPTTSMAGAVTAKPKTYAQVSTELGAVRNAIASDELTLKQLKADLTRYERNANQNKDKIARIETEILKVQARLDAYKKQKADLEAQLEALKKAPPVTVTPAPAKPIVPAAPISPTPTAPVTPSKPYGYLPRRPGKTTTSYISFTPPAAPAGIPAPAPAENIPLAPPGPIAGEYIPLAISGSAIATLIGNTAEQPPTGEEMTPRKKELWKLTPNQLKIKLGNMGISMENMPGSTKEKIDKIIELETPKQPTPAPTPGPTPPTPTPVAPPVTPPTTTEEWFDIFLPGEGEAQSADPTVRSLQQQGFQVTVDHDGNILDIWDPATGAYYDKNGKLIGTRTTPYGEKAPIPGAVTTRPTGPDATTITANRSAITITNEPGTYSVSPPNIRRWLDRGFIVTADENYNIIDIWDPETGNLYNTDGEIIGYRDRSYANAQLGKIFVKE